MSSIRPLSCVGFTVGVVVVIGCKPEAKITDDVVAAAKAIAALPEEERGDLVFVPALGVYQQDAYLAPKGWERDYGDVFHSTPLRATYAVKHECPDPSCESRTESEWRTTGVSSRDGSNGRERIVVAKWPVEGRSQKITTCEVVVDFDGEPRSSPKRAILGALEKACRAVHPFF